VCVLLLYLKRLTTALSDDKKLFFACVNQEEKNSLEPTQFLFVVLFFLLLPCAVSLVVRVQKETTNFKRLIYINETAMTKQNSI